MDKFQLKIIDIASRVNMIPAMPVISVDKHCKDIAEELLDILFVTTKPTSPAGDGDE